MAEIYVVRHGQASFGAANYDQLSQLGWQQSRWLGEWFAQQGLSFDRLVTGTLTRHRETLSGILQGMSLESGKRLEPQEIAGLNEYDSEKLLAAYLKNDDPSAVLQGAFGDDRRQYFKVLRSALYAWANGELNPTDYLNFAQFRQGVVNGLFSACAAGAQRVLLVSSGGPISNMVGHVLQSPNSVTVDLNLQTRNCSVTQFAFSARDAASLQESLAPRALNLMSFNNVPHLLEPSRHSAITYS